MSPSRSGELAGSVHNRTRRLASSQRGERSGGLLLSAPALALFLALWAIPAIASLYLSFTDYNLAQAPEWVGLDNYRNLFSDKRFWSSLRVTTVLTLFAVGPTIFLALLLALPLARGGTVTALIRGLIFVPAVIPLVSAVLVWQAIYQTNGLANTVLGWLGVNPQPWLTNARTALVAIVVMVIWKYTGLYVLIFIAGLQGIPRNLYEAAAIDGSKGARTFLFITIPQLRRTFLFVIVIGVTGAVQSFVPVFILTGGGPVNATEVLPLYLFNNAFLFSRFGYASAIAVVLLIFLLVFSVIQFSLVDAEAD